MTNHLNRPLDPRRPNPRPFPPSGWLLALVLAVVATACGDDGDEGRDGPLTACDERDSGQLCTEFWGDHLSREQRDEMCAAGASGVVPSCPRDGLKGSCRIYGGTSLETRTFYYTDNVSSAAMACSMLKGEWTPGP